MSAVETLFQQEINQAGNLWDAIVSRVPTVFGKLMRASSCRIPGSNRYRHPVLEQAFSPEIAERVLELSHCRYFDQWLSMALQDRHADFVKYAETAPSAEHPRELLRGLGYTLMPPSTNKPQQYQFDTDLAVVLVLLD